MAEIVRSAELRGPMEDLWARLSDLEGLGEWAPGVDHVRLVTERREGPGAARRVQLGQIAVIETVVAWQAPALLSYRIEGLPFTDSVVTTWNLAGPDREPGGVITATVRTRMQRRPGPPAAVAQRLLVRRMGRFAEQMLEGLG